MLKKLAILVIAGMAALVALTSVARADDGYRVLSQPVQHDTHGKILVQEIFWYGCPHCYALEPSFEKWRAQQPKDVEVSLLPATLGKTWTEHARAYYAAVDLGIINKTHDAFFNAIQRGGQTLVAPNDIANFYSHYGVTKKQVLDTLSSFGLSNQINQAHSEVLGYQVLGTPTIVVDGKYVIDPQSAGGLENMLNVTDHVISMVRAQHKHS